MIKAVLFDLDGTVLASKEGIFRSAAYALGKLSYTMPSENEMLAFLGPPLSVGFQSVCHVREEHIDQAVRLYREYYNNGGKYEASLFDGVEACLQALRANGFKTYITTSKPHVFAKDILAHFGADHLFDGIYGSEFDGTRGKKAEVVQYCLDMHNLKADDSILVGDRHFDVFGAKECGMRCVGVSYGYGSKQELTDAGAWHIIDTPNELLSLIIDLNPGDL